MKRRTLYPSILGLLLTMALVAPAAGTPLTANPALDQQGKGLSIAEAGVGMRFLGTGTRTLSINIPGPVQKAFLYWAGRELEGCLLGACFRAPNVQPFGDQVFGFDGSLVTGTITGIEDESNSTIGYRADVTSAVVAKGTGVQSFTIQDGDTTNNLDRLNGAGLLIIYKDLADTVTYRVMVYEGMDYVSSATTNPFADNSITSPVTFNHGSTAASRSAQLVIFAGDGVADRPDRLTISNNPDQIDQMNGSDGREWDTDSFGITIPANVGSTTAQMIAEPPDSNADSLLWQLGALRVPLPAGTSRGCTPGYWKNHEDSWASSGFTTAQTVASVFTVPAALSTLGANTLHEALSFGGGSGVVGGAKILLRASVAALLNAGHANVNYPQSVAQVISGVNVALASNNRNTMLALATQLDNANNGGCTLN